MFFFLCSSHQHPTAIIRGIHIRCVSLISRIGIPSKRRRSSIALEYISMQEGEAEAIKYQAHTDENLSFRRHRRQRRQGQHHQPSQRQYKMISLAVALSLSVTPSMISHLRVHSASQLSVGRLRSIAMSEVMWNIPKRETENYISYCYVRVECCNVDTQKVHTTWAQSQYEGTIFPVLQPVLFVFSIVNEGVNRRMYRLRIRIIPHKRVLHSAHSTHVQTMPFSSPTRSTNACWIHHLLLQVYATHIKINTNSVR